MRAPLIRLAAAATLVFLGGTTMAAAQNRPSIREAAARVSFASPAQTGQSDSNKNGAVIGALVGGAGMGAFLAILSARCGKGCENDLEAWAPFAAVGVGAAGGAAVGWLIDKAHRASSRNVSIAPTLSRRERGLRVAVRF